MKSVEEVDDQVRDLSRGGNAAVRGVLFANMYIQVGQYEKEFGSTKFILVSKYFCRALKGTELVRSISATEGA